ncbi:MAG: 2-hydroxychromene-2-carboxylate isomerase [Sandaracinaceae bacterium]|nr:2-hydroxychromene-2-carboxylate isomerase [Sandaracinaceae bacterium]
MDLEFFFDVGSPYSYLASTQLAGLSERTGVHVRWRPFLLGGVFKASGNEMPARVAAKAKWMLDDLTRLGEHFGVPFRMNSHFPVNTLSAMRAIVAAGRVYGEQAIEPLGRSMFDGMWVEDRNLADGDEVAFCIGRVQGLEIKRLAAEVSSQATKDALRDATDEAVRRGAFGAPTFFLGDVMYWGHDRLPLIEAELGKRG